MNIYFSTTEKEKYFDELCSMYFNRNFGRTSKQDLDLLMFHFYMNQLDAQSKNEQGTTDYNKCSDYRIAKDLGITPQRVSNLRLKRGLVFAVDTELESKITDLIDNARLEGNKVIMNIPEQLLYNEIQNLLEEKGFYIEMQFNRKLLIMRAEYFIQFVIMFEPKANQQKAIQELNQRFKDRNKDNSVFEAKNIGKKLIGYGEKIANIVSAIAPLLTIGDTIKNIFA